MESARIQRAPGHTFAPAAGSQRVTISANVSTPELPLAFLIFFSQEPLTASLSPNISTFVKPEENVCHILVLSYSTLHTADAVGAWKEARTEDTPFSHVAVAHYHIDDGNVDFLVLLDLLDFVRTGARKTILGSAVSFSDSPSSSVGSQSPPLPRSASREDTSLFLRS